mgnify:CR=1 FL=1
MVSFRNDKSMNLILIKFSCVIAVFSDGFGCFLVVHITDALEKEERKNVLLIGAGINVGPK